VRPLRHVDEWGIVSYYTLNPTFYSVYAILIVELLERFAFYGINYTQTSYLTGAYNADWNADMDAVRASTYVSISVAVAYTAPFVGARLADAWLGDYNTILFGCLVCYLPGLFLIAATTVPGLVVSYTPLPDIRYEDEQDTANVLLSAHTGGEDKPEGHFNRSVVAFALLFLWPVGTGIVKSAVNVFGARQFHPLLQSAQIESYYVNFYTSINVGALLGGCMVPLLAQVNVTAAYLLPAAMLAIGVVVFTSHQQRYVKTTPNHKAVPPSGVGTTKKKKTKKGLVARLFCSLFKKKKRVAMKPVVPLTRQGSFVGSSGANKMGLMVIVQISILVVPFNIAYSQMSTTFIV
jgi:dipeptide/tripeptide permease